MILVFYWSVLIENYFPVARSSLSNHLLILFNFSSILATDHCAMHAHLTSISFEYKEDLSEDCFLKKELIRT